MRTAAETPVFVQFAVEDEVVGGQRVLAVELLFNSIAVGNIIREGKTAGLRNAMQMGKSQGMQTLDTAVHDLLNQGVINQATADAALKA